MTKKASYYRIEEIRGLKDQPDGWYVFSRHCRATHIKHTKIKAKGLRNKHHRVSKGFKTRRGALRAAKNLQLKSDIFIKSIMENRKQ